MLATLPDIENKAIRQLLNRRSCSLYRVTPEQSLKQQQLLEHTINLQILNHEN